MIYIALAFLIIFVAILAGIIFDKFEKKIGSKSMFSEALEKMRKEAAVKKANATREEENVISKEAYDQAMEAVGDLVADMGKDAKSKANDFNGNRKGGVS